MFYLLQVPQELLAEGPCMVSAASLCPRGLGWAGEVPKGQTRQRLSPANFAICSKVTLAISLAFLFSFLAAHC